VAQGISWLRKRRIFKTSVLDFFVDRNTHTPRPEIPKGAVARVTNTLSLTVKIKISSLSPALSRRAFVAPDNLEEDIV